MAICLRGLLSSRVCLAALPARTPVLLVGLRSQCTLNKPAAPSLCLALLKKDSLPVILSRSMSGSKQFIIMPSRYAYRRFKSSLHLWVMVALLPGLAIVTYCNIFIGPAELREIPPGYYPKEWEYYQHPISRWIAKNVPYSFSPQQVHETKLARIDLEMDRARMRRLEKKVTALMNERKDYAGYEFKNYTGFYYTELAHDRARQFEEEQINALRYLR